MQGKGRKKQDTTICEKKIYSKLTIKYKSFFIFYGKQFRICIFSFFKTDYEQHKKCQRKMKNKNA